MIYPLMRLVAEASVGIFYRRVEVRGLEGIPGRGPAILACNHPNTMMDALLVGLRLGRRVRFLAKSTLFRGRFQGWFIRQLGALPVVRQGDVAEGIASSMEASNDQTFARCHQALLAGDAIVIFPEGVSHAEPRLMPLRTGAARIALGAEAEREFELGVSVVPIGLNYREPDRFDSDVVIEVGKSIDVRDYADAWRRDPKQAVTRLTDDLEERMQALVVHLPDPDLFDLVQAVDEVYSGRVLEQLSGDVHPTAVTRRIGEAVVHFREVDPGRVKQMRDHLRRYRTLLDDLQLPERALRYEAAGPRAPGGSRLVRGLTILLGAPVALYGWLTNVIPYLLPRLAVRLLRPDLTEVSSLKLLSGIVAFLPTYALEVAAVGWLLDLDLPRMIAFAVSLPLGGFFALRYGAWLSRQRVRVRLITVLLSRRRLLATARRMRSELIAELDQAAEDFRST